MLTKTDLSQIQKTVQNVLKDYPTKEDLTGALQNHPTKADLTSALQNHPTKADLTSALQNHPTKADLTKALRPIRKNIKSIISLFDKEYVILRKRVKKIEEHLHFPTAI